MPIHKIKNQHFFKRWSPEMAYILGYFAADGNMIRNKRGAHYIEFQSTDKELIYKVRSLLNSNLKVASKKRQKNHKTIYRIQIGSKQIFSDLIRLGFVPNKSKRLEFPSVPIKYLPHFVRGYFDGDGHVSMGIYKRSEPRKNPYSRVLTSGFTSGDGYFLLQLRKRLKMQAGLQGSTAYYSSGGYRLSYSINDSRRLYNFMYTGLSNGLYLKRKKEVFEKFYVGR